MLYLTQDFGRSRAFSADPKVQCEALCLVQLPHLYRWGNWAPELLKATQQARGGARMGSQDPGLSASWLRHLLPLIRPGQPSLQPLQKDTQTLSRPFLRPHPWLCVYFPRSQPLLIIESMKAKAFSLSTQHLPQLLSQTHPRPLRLPFCLLLRKRSSLKTLTLRLHTYVILTVFVLSSLSRRFWKDLELWNQPEGPCALCWGHPSPEVPPH